MMANWLDLNYRKMIIEEIEGNENLNRKAVAYKQFRVENDHLKDYVQDDLLCQFSKDTVSEMPVVSSLNVQKRIVDQEASIYMDPPKREFTDLSDEQEDQLRLIYKDMNANAKMHHSNRAYVYQRQNLLMVVPQKGKLILRTLKPYQYDVVPDSLDPEVADSFIISSFDKTQFDTNIRVSDSSEQKSGRIYSDGTNQKISDIDDWKIKNKTYIVWSKDYNFTMDSSGRIQNPETGEFQEFVDQEQIVSPLAEVQALPFVDIADEKDFSFWVEQGTSLTDFTIQLNTAFSYVGQVVKMNGFSVAWMKGPENLLPQSVQIGPNFLLRLVTDANNDQSTDFGFASPNSDIQGSLEYINTIISTFLSTRGVDPKTISTNGESTTYSSGVERLLAMFEQFEATKSDYETYRKAENELYDVIKSWLKVLEGTEVLKPQYRLVVPDDSEVMVKFKGPETVLSESDKLDLAQRKIELGLASRIDAISWLKEVPRERAEEIAAQIDKDEALNGQSVDTANVQQEEI